MILKQFSSRQPLLLILVPVIVLGILIPLEFKGFLQYSTPDFPATKLLFLIHSIPWLSVSLTAIFIVSGALLGNIVFNRHEFNTAPSFVPALIYALTATVFSLTTVKLLLLFACIPIILGINRILDVFRHNKALAPYFNAGFWFGLAVLIYPPFLPILIGLWVCIASTRVFSWREFLLPLFAFASPFIYWWAFLYWNDQLDQLVLYKKIITFNPTLGPDWSNGWTRAFDIVIGIIFVFSLRGFIFISDRSSNKARGVKRNFAILALTIISSVGLSIYFANEWAAEVILVPFMVIAGNWFTNYRMSLIAPFAFYALLITSALLVLHAYHIF
ncbi:MAG: hypothetical protein R2809_03010 [Flavobacteriales bacterium]